MSLTELLFSFKGRINRKPWWLASLAVGVATSLITAILEFAARLSGNTAVDPGTQVVEPTGILSLVVLAVVLANTWITFALCVKRLHDRDRWWLVWQSLILALIVILIVVAIAVPKEEAPLWYTLAGGVAVAAFVVSIWLFVEIGFLRGTQGPNRFGPDPPGAPKADAQPSSDPR